MDEGGGQTGLPEGAVPAPVEQPTAESPEAPVPQAVESSTPPIQRRDRWAHRRGEPRTFAALWILYLFGATAVSLGTVGMLGLLSTDIYRPAAQGLLTLVSVGIAIVWPMVRLSQEFPKRPLAGALADLLVVFVPAQAVVWPQGLLWMAAWPWTAVLSLSALFGAWCLVMGGLLANCYAWTRVEDSAAGPKRWIMMLAIAVLVLAGPAVLLTQPLTLSDAADPNPVSGWLMASPITAVHELTRDRSWSGSSARVDARHWAALGATGAVGLLCWGTALAGTVVISRKRA